MHSNMLTLRKFSLTTLLKSRGRMREDPGNEVEFSSVTDNPIATRTFLHRLSCTSSESVFTRLVTSPLHIQI